MIALGQGLVDRKKYIEFTLSIHTAAGVDATRATVDRLDSKLDRLIAIVAHHTGDEQGVGIW